MKDLSAKIASKGQDSTAEGFDSSQNANLYRTNQEMRKMVDKLENECKANTEIKFENARLRGTVDSKDSELRDLQGRLEIMLSHPTNSPGEEKTQSIIVDT